MARSSIVEHSAECRTIHIAGMYSEANNPAGVLIHHHHDPVRPSE